MDQTLYSDIRRISNAAFIPWEALKGKTIFITGATGLVGFNLVHALVYASEVRNLDLSVVALVRDETRAKERFSDIISSPVLQLLVGPVEEFPWPDRHIDYIIHGASQTASKAFVEQPVETIMTAIVGTQNVLELARRDHVKGMVFLSSMEVYGHPQKGHKVTEADIGSLSPLEVRNSYPIAKLQCECLCRAYAEEYGLPVTIARLTQTFGAGVSKTDGRVFAYFGKCVQEKQDIVLRTRGETERSYLYTSDAVTAIFTMMLKGVPGEAYNVADEDTYCSIAQMAEKIAAAHKIKVRYDIQDERASGYPSTIYMDLDTSKLKSLGWKVLYKMGGCIVDMIQDMVSMWTILKPSDN